MKKIYSALLLLAIFSMSIMGHLLPPATTIASGSSMPALPMIVIDPGHGGEDGGAIGPEGRPESQYNLEIALKTELMLRFLGYQTTMTRTEDISIHDESAKTLRQKKNSDLANRIRLIQSFDNAVFLSIHQNKFEQTRFSGAQVFYNDAPSSAGLAKTVQDALKAALNPRNERQPKSLDVKLMNETRHPGVLVECGFLSNAAEEQRLRDPNYQRKLAMTLAISLSKWVLQP